MPTNDDIQRHVSTALVAAGIVFSATLLLQSKNIPVRHDVTGIPAAESARNGLPGNSDSAASAQPVPPSWQ